MSVKTLYFAYGSNMSQSRIRDKCPSAALKCVGKLKSHRLDFNHCSNRWHGAVATIVPHLASNVWGVIWEIDTSDLKALDIQEGVVDGVYQRKKVNISNTTGKDFDCEIYVQTKQPEEYNAPDKLPKDRQPSQVYLNLIITGAEENRLPADYVKILKSFKHNGYNGETNPSLSLLNK